MNSKLLFVATLTLAFASSLAFAQESKSLTRADVVAAYQHAVADGSLKKTGPTSKGRCAAATTSSPRCRRRRRADCSAR